LSGTTWTASEVDGAAYYAVLYGVSCRSATSCTAVGDTAGENNTVVLAENWNGATWTDAGAPQPAQTPTAELFGDSCSVGASTCEAVGFAEYNGPTVTLAELLS
jgi:hypothetical protein